MALQIQNPGLTVTPNVVQLDSNVQMSGQVQSSPARSATITFKIENPSNPTGPNTTGVKFRHNGNLVDTYSFPQSLIQGLNTVSDTKTLIDNGVGQSKLIVIRVIVVSNSDGESDHDGKSITVNPKVQAS